MSRRRLGVKLDHIATLRQARRVSYPDPVAAASVAEAAGAGFLTAHLREDRRHITDRDVRLIREVAQVPLNLELAPTQEALKAAYEAKPDQVTVVPERREEVTTEGGLDVAHQRDQVRKHVQGLRDGDIHVCLFVDPDLDQIRAAHRCDSTSVQLHTGKFCQARGSSEKRQELQKIVDAARAATKLGMQVSAGHGINYHNVQALVEVEEIETFHVGHSIVSRAVLVGFDRAVRDMVALINP
jgi:pyridoxine 5-phosphate synthase